MGAEYDYAYNFMTAEERAAGLPEVTSEPATRRIPTPDDAELLVLAVVLGSP